MKKSNKKFFKVFNWEIYPFDLLFCYNCTDKDVREYINKHFTKLSKKDEKLLTFKKQSGRTVHLENGAIVLWVHNPKNVGILAHELYHAVNMLFYKVNIPPTDSSEEAYAYAIEFMMNKIVKNYDKKI